MNTRRLQMKMIGHLINGKHQLEKIANTKPVYNPATGEVISNVEIASNSLINNAIKASKQAFETWSQTSPIKRAEILFKYKNLIEKNIDELAQLITLEHGKTIPDAKGSISRGLEVVAFACNTPDLLKGDYSEQVSTDIASYSLRQPIGVCAGITPFNFPAMVPMWMYPLAIACGNTFILKPSERDPSAPMRLVELLYEAGLPDNVVQVINGDKTTVDALLRHPDIVAISSVGSTPVAKYIYEQAAMYGKRVQALGGAKNHAVIMPDADMEFVAEQLVGAAFGSCGQRCMAISVAVIVGDEQDENLVNKVIDKARKLKIGAGDNTESDMGPVNNPEALERIQHYIHLGIRDNATLLLDGREFSLCDNSNGFFVGPTVFDRVTSDMKIYQDEIFGPMLCIVRVKTLDEAIKLINHNAYGNGTAIFTSNGNAANHFVKAIQVGLVGVNVPIPVPVAYYSFGGWKQSLFGDTHMHGHEGIRFYTKMKNVTARWDWNEDVASGMIMPTHD